MVATELIAFVAQLSLKDLLTYGASGAAVAKFGTEGLAYVKEKIKEKWAEHQYGFTPDKDEAIALNKISKKDSYKRLVDCIGNHWSLPIIRLGIYASELNEEGRKGMVEKIRSDVYRRYGARGILILNLASTGMIMSVIEYISDMKFERDLNKNDLVLELDKIFTTWKAITIFVKNESDYKRMELLAMNRMLNEMQTFFIFACGPIPVKKATAFVEMLKVNGSLKKYGYTSNCRSRKTSGSLEVFFGVLEKEI